MSNPAGGFISLAKGAAVGSFAMAIGAMVIGGAMSVGAWIWTGGAVGLPQTFGGIRGWFQSAG